MIVILLICIFFIAFATKNEEDEERKLVHRYNKLIKQKELIENLKLNLEVIFTKAYKIVKLLVVVLTASALATTCFYTKVGKGESEIFTMMNNCLTVIAASSFIVLMFCFYFEQNPINIFKLRETLYKMTQNLVYRKYNRHLEKIPKIEMEIEEVKLKAKIITTNNNEPKIS